MSEHERTGKGVGGPGFNFSHNKIKVSNIGAEYPDLGLRKYRESSC